MTDEKCLDCKFFEHIFDKGGRCHRYAPRPEDYCTNPVVWPHVETDDFCGEFVLKQDKERQ